MSFADEPKMDIGSVLKRVRKARGITLRQVEAITGISNAYLSQLETGKVNNPSHDKVIKIQTFIVSLPDKPKDGCPLCNSADVKDVSMWGGFKFDMNTPIGTRHPPKHKIFDVMCCNNCGILFRILNPPK
jgi:hypothetical protein